MGERPYRLCIELEGDFLAKIDLIRQFIGPESSLAVSKDHINSEKGIEQNKSPYGVFILFYKEGLGTKIPSIGRNCNIVNVS